MRLSVFSKLALVFTLALTACGTQASLEASPHSAVLSELQGSVEARQAQEQDFAGAADGYILNENGQLRTGDDGKVRLDLSSGSILRIAPSSLFTLVSNSPADGGLDTQVGLEAGELWIILNGGELQVDTPAGQASVRGSRLGVAGRPDGRVRVTCLEGDCSFRNRTGVYPILPGFVLECSGLDDVPVIFPMTSADVAGWLAIDPEAAAFLPALTAAAVTPTPAASPTATLTPAPPTATASPVPTFSVLAGVVQADSLSCRYGPGADYLYQYGLFEGSQLQVLGRDETGAWIYVRVSADPCWVNARFVELDGEIAGLEMLYPGTLGLPPSRWPEPDNVAARRAGDQVHISWDEYLLPLGERESAESPLYLAELWLCADAVLTFTPLGAWEPALTVTDEAGCAEPSHGRVYLAEKHGYAGPVEIPWPGQP